MANKILGETITPYSYEEAKARAEKHLLTNEYMALFEEAEEVNITHANIPKYVYGEVILSVDLAIMIADTLGAHVKDIWK